MCRMRAVAVVGVLLAASMAAEAQNAGTGLLTGTVRSASGEPSAGVAVQSEALQGERTTETDGNGVYVLRALPLGAYRVRFAAAGMAPLARTVAVHATSTTRVDADLTVAPIAESLVVTAGAPPVSGTAGVSQTAGKALVDQLPMSRRPVDIAELAPGLTANTFQAGQLAVGGAFGYDNVFLVNGVDVNDNVFGTANTLFIEEAIEETSVLMHGVQASFGRFTGGVVNVVTKSGANAFSGSVRENLSNPSWIGETPRQRTAGVKNRNVLGYAHEATFGGPIRRDCLWFFAAGRLERAQTPNTFPQTGGAFTRTDRNRRGEVKLTGRIRAADTMQFTYIGDGTEQVNTAAVGATRLPNQLVVAGAAANRSPPRRGTAAGDDRMRAWVR